METGMNNPDPPTTQPTAEQIYGWLYETEGSGFMTWGDVMDDIKAVLDARAALVREQADVPAADTTTEAQYPSSEWWATHTNDERPDYHGDISNESVGVQAAYRYLSDLPYTQWGKWSVDQPDRRLLAARWLDEQIRTVNKTGQLIRSAVRETGTRYE